MANVFVQFTNSSKTVISGWFGAAQPEGAYPNSGELDILDTRWATYYEAQPASAQVGMPSPPNT